MNMEERCNDCKYWKQHYETSCGGKCRRLPPVLDGLQILFAKDNGHQDEFADESILWWSQPATSFDDWCGEFVKRPNVELTGVPPTDQTKEQ